MALGSRPGTPEEARDATRTAFTTQATGYAASAVVADRERRRAFVDSIDPAPDARVLDVATGPGFTALAFAARVRFVLGVDLTPAMLAQARRNAAGPAGGSVVEARRTTADTPGAAF